MFCNNLNILNLLLFYSKKSPFLSRTHVKVGSWEIDFSKQQEGEVYWSEMTKELLEVEPDYQPSVEDTLSFIEPQSRGKAREAFTRAVTYGTPYDNELLVRTGKGNTRWIRNIGQAEFNDGECVRVYGSFQDITDRKTSEKKYREIFDLSPQPVWVYDPETLEFLDVNQAAIDHYGYTREEFLAMTLKDIRPEEDIPDLLEATRQPPGPSERYFEGQFRHQIKDGTLIQVNIKRNSIDYEGQTASMVLAEDVTEKRQAQRALELSEQKFKAMVQSGASLIAVLDEDGNFRYVSDNYKKITGWTPQELLGQNAFGFMHPEDRDRIQGAFDTLQIQGGTQHTLPFRFKHKEGHWIWKESIGSDLSNDGIINGYVINCHEVTDRQYYMQLEKLEREILEKNTLGSVDLSKLTEELLEKLEALHPRMRCSLHRIVEGRLQPLAAPSLPPGFVDAIAGVPVGPNTGSSGTAAYRKEPVIAENIFEDPRWEGYRHLGQKYNFSACWSQPVMGHNQQVIATLAIYYTEPHRPSDRERNTMGRIVHLLRLLFDSFEKTKAEQELALREQRFKTLVQDGSDLIAILDEQANYTYVAPSSESILGISPDEFMGTNALDYIHEEHTSRVQQTLATLPDEQRTKIDPFLFKNGNGEWRWIETVITNLLDNPAVGGYVANSRDVTDQKEQEHQLREALREKETLLSEIHHRVKNNLAVVSGMMQLQAFEVDQPQVENKLLDGVTRIQSMATIHELLYKSGTFTRLTFSEVVKELAEGVIETLKNGIDVQCELDLDPVTLNVNQAIPCSLIINEVLTNSIKHGFKGKQHGKITICLNQHGEQVQLSIEDNGVGVPDEFDESSTTSLGLSLIRNLVSQLEGEYEYESLTQGLCFRLEFKKADVKGIGSSAFTKAE